MAGKRIDGGSEKKPLLGSRMLTADEIADLRRSAREALEICKAHFRKNPL